MKRTQIQLPDTLYAAARDIAEQKEISMAELVRRGLEYMVAVTPRSGAKSDAWELPEAYPLGGKDPFAAPDWRANLHTDRLRVAEHGESYDPGLGK